MTHQLIQSDNVAAMASMPKNSIDACITDSPYGMEMVAWDRKVPSVKTWKHILRVLKPGAFVVSFCSPRQYHRMAVVIEDAGFIFKDMIFWLVPTKMVTKNKLKSAHEPIFVGQKPYEGGSIESNQKKWGAGTIDTTSTRTPWQGKPPNPRWFKASHLKPWGVRGQQFNPAHLQVPHPNGRYPLNAVGHFNKPYFYAPRVSRRERGSYNDHPTVKPIALMRWLCRLYCPLDGTVLDPFMGSGSTAIGAIREHRNFIGIDNEKHYIDIAERRIKDLQRKAAALATSRKPIYLPDRSWEELNPTPICLPDKSGEAPEKVSFPHIAPLLKEVARQEN